MISFSGWLELSDKIIPLWIQKFSFLLIFFFFSEIEQQKFRTFEDHWRGKTNMIQWKTFCVGVGAWIGVPAAACAGNLNKQTSAIIDVSVCNVHLFPSMVLLTHHFSCALPSRMHRRAHVSGNVTRCARATSHDFCVWQMSYIGAEVTTQLVVYFSLLHKCRKENTNWDTQTIPHKTQRERCQHSGTNHDSKCKSDDTSTMWIMWIM